MVFIRQTWVHKWQLYKKNLVLNVECTKSQPKIFSWHCFNVFNVTLVQIQCILHIALLLTRSMNALVGIFQP